VPATDSYALHDVPDPDHPSTVYHVVVSAAPYHADLVAADFGGDGEVVFDGYGMPDSGGSVVVQVGDYQRVVVVEADTGQARVE